MKASEIRELSKDELDLKLKELQELMFRYRFQIALGQLENPIKLRQTRRDIARINTILCEKLHTISDDEIEDGNGKQE